MLKLSDNLFGDSLNPIFSTPEFRSLINLKVLDLSGNKIKALEEGIFKGCDKLQVSLRWGWSHYETSFHNCDESQRMARHWIAAAPRKCISQIKETQKAFNLIIVSTQLCKLPSKNGEANDRPRESGPPRWHNCWRNFVITTSTHCRRTLSMCRGGSLWTWKIGHIVAKWTEGENEFK